MKYRFGDKESPNLDDAAICHFVRQNEALYHAVCAAVHMGTRRSGCSPDEIIEAFISAFGNEQEMGAVLSIDGQGRVMQAHRLSMGSATATILDVKDICRLALVDGARSVVLVHCHPSGDCRPSETDRNVTRRIRDALRILDIELLDHIVIGAQSFSFAASGWM